MNKSTRILIPILVFVASHLFLVFGLFNTWFGEARPGIMKFCEAARDGIIKQPANSFSNLAFAIDGIVLIFHCIKKTDKKNLMTSSSFYPLVMSSILILLSAGSFAMHATNAFWGGFADLFTMFLIASFVSGYSLTKVFNWKFSTFTIYFLITVIVNSFIYVSEYNQFGFVLSIVEFTFMAQILLAIFLEIYAYYFINKNIEMKYGVLCVSTLIIAFTIWNLSVNQDSILCNPHSLIQGHAAWHILDAAAVYLSYLFYASENEVSHV